MPGAAGNPVLFNPFVLSLSKHKKFTPYRWMPFDKLRANG